MVKDIRESIVQDTVILMLKYMPIVFLCLELWLIGFLSIDEIGHALLSIFMLGIVALFWISGTNQRVEQTRRMILDIAQLASS
jgi:hypothetical protein